MTNRQCAVCGADYKLRKARQQTCSRSCGRRLANPKISRTHLETTKTGHKVDIVCDGCGIVFRHYLSQRPKLLKFCTKACGLNYQKQRSKQADIDKWQPRDKQSIVVDYKNKQIRNA